MKTIILASQSPRRKELIQVLDRPFKTFSVDLEEKVIPGESPEQVVMSLAFEKAEAACKALGEDGIYIGSDTIVSLNGEIFGKPIDRQDAKEMLEKLSGKTHQVFTGLALIDPVGKHKQVIYVKTDVVFRTLSEELIQWYLNTGEPFDKAGAYGIQGFGSRLVTSISGDFFNVVGLPVVALDQLLTQFAL